MKASVYVEGSKFAAVGGGAALGLKGCGALECTLFFNNQAQKSSKILGET